MNFEEKVSQMSPNLLRIFFLEKILMIFPHKINMLKFPKMSIFPQKMYQESKVTLYSSSYPSQKNVLIYYMTWNI